MKKKRPYGDTLKARLQASLNDCLHHFLLADAHVRGVLINGTRMINEMRWNHELGLLETLVLGHAYLSAALMSANLKGNDRLGLQVECSGPIKGLVVEANAFGEVRGYLKNVPIPIDKPLESFNLSPFFGAGFLSVTKYLEDAKQPFTGQVMLEHGSLAKDLTVYFEKSEQIRTAVVLSIVPDEQGEIVGAGGLFLQVLPGADDQVLKILEERLGHLPSLGGIVNEDGFPKAWLEKILPEFDPHLLEHRGVEFMCHCSRKKIKQMLAMLDIRDLEEMAANGPFPIQIRCHHCNTSYDFSQIQMRKVQGLRTAQSRRKAER
jgi:molecular chaperone Hsp33